MGVRHRSERQNNQSMVGRRQGVYQSCKKLICSLACQGVLISQANFRYFYKELVLEIKF
jgi:hypothetical protein